jgi:hypothetical protein
MIKILSKSSTKELNSGFKVVWIQLLKRTIFVKKNKLVIA